MPIIDKISIAGYKSIRSLNDFSLNNLNVLIGSNGAGKSNFIQFFRFLNSITKSNLQLHTAQEGGADALLHFGPRITKEISAKLKFGVNGYEFSLTPTQDGKLVFSSETTIFWLGDEAKRQIFGSGQTEARLLERKDPSGAAAPHGPPYYVYQALRNWVVYHFHDTSAEAGLRRQGPINDNEHFRPNAENLAAFLYGISQTNPGRYQRIVDAVRLCAPFFDDFYLRPVSSNSELIQLEWRQVKSDYPMRASQLSDGTLRFICLATALLQPNPPSTMLFDEPELGLHPYATTLLGGLCHQSIQNPWGGNSRQLILSTQSAQLLNEFSPEDIVVVERQDNQSTFERLDPSHLSEWLIDYTLGELWQKNLLGGRPKAELVRVN